VKMGLTEKKVSLKTFLVTTALIAVLVFAGTHYIFASSGTITIEPSSFAETVEYAIIEEDGLFKAKNGTTGAVEISGTEPIPVVNNAMGNLSSGRTWKETVLIMTEIEIDHDAYQITIPNYTILDFNGHTLKVRDSTPYNDDYYLLANRDNPATDIELRNMNFDENAAGAPDAWAWVFGWTNTSNLILYNCDFSSPVIEYSTYWYGYNNDTEIKYCKFAANDFNLESSDDRLNNLVFEYNEVTNGQIYTRGTAYIRYNRLIGYDVSIHVGNGDESEISHNYIHPTEWSGYFIYVIYSDRTTINNNIIQGYGTTSGVGIFWTYCDEILATTNQVYNVKVGMENDEANNTLISGNTITKSTYGIELYQSDTCKVSGNNIRDATRGVYGYGSAKKSDFNSITDNKFYGEMTYGVYFDSACRYNNIRHNYFNITGTGFNWGGTDNVAEDNIGFTTENTGTATISSSTSTTFNHELVGTPTGVWASFDSTGYNGWTWTATATQITVTVGQSGTYEVYWQAEYKP